MTTAFAIVTPEDRRCGVTAHGALCPIGRAVTRAVRSVTGRDVRASAAHRFIRIILRDSVDLEGRKYRYFDVPMTEDAAFFMELFDQGDVRQHGIEHLSIPVEIPDDLPPPTTRIIG